MATASITPFPLTLDAAVDVSTTGHMWISGRRTGPSAGRFHVGEF